MRNYEVKIKESSKELSAVEKIKLKNTNDCLRLNAVLQNSDTKSITINVADWCVLDVHNEKSEDKDYTQYIIITSSGEKYLTGSQSLWNAFMDIYDELKEAGLTTFDLKIYLMSSNNYSGKEFISCSLV